MLNWIRNMKNQKWYPFAVALCVAILFYVALSRFDVVLSGAGSFLGFIRPVLISLAIAYVLDPLVMFFERTIFSKLKSEQLSRNFSVLLMVISVAVMIAILMIVMIPPLVSSITSLMTNLRNYTGTFSDMLEQLQESAAVVHLDLTKVTKGLISYINNVANQLPENLSRIASTSVSIGSGIFNGVISFILAIYVLLDKGKLMVGVKRLAFAILPEQKYVSYGDFWNRCNKILIRYIGGDLLDGLIVGMANCIFMMILRMPYAALLSVIVGVTNLAPTFGPIVGGAIGVLLLLLVNPWSALWFLVFTIVLQTCDGYVIKPKLFGNTLGVSSVWILMALIVFGRMFGVLGVLLAIPFAAIMNFLYHDWIARREKEKQNQ